MKGFFEADSDISRWLKEKDFDFVKDYFSVAHGIKFNSYLDDVLSELIEKEASSEGIDELIRLYGKGGTHAI